MPKRQSAYFKATQGTAVQPEGEPAQEKTPSHSDTVTQRVKVDKKTSFYLSDAQKKKLNDLEAECWQRFSKKINRNEIVRFLIDGCSLETLQALIDSKEEE